MTLNPLSLSSGPRYEQVRSQLSSMHHELVSKMDKLENLQTQFKKHQEDAFFRVFLQVMDKMASELGRAQLKYENVDKEVERDDKINRLTKQLYFFRHECWYQHQQCRAAKQQLAQVKLENQQLKSEVGELKFLLRKKVEELYREKTGLFPKTATRGFTPMAAPLNQRYSSQGKPLTATDVSYFDVKNGRSTSVRSSFSGGPVFNRISQLLDKLCREVQRESGVDQKMLGEKILEYEKLLNRLKKRLNNPCDASGIRTTTYSTDKQSRQTEQRPLKYSRLGRRIKKVSPIMITDELSEYK